MKIEHKEVFFKNLDIAKTGSIRIELLSHFKNSSQVKKKKKRKNTTDDISRVKECVNNKQKNPTGLESSA